MRWRRWCGRVIDIAPDIVATKQLQSRRPGILAVLHNPQPTALVETQVQRIGNRGFLQQQVQPQVVDDLQHRFVLLRLQHVRIGTVGSSPRADVAGDEQQNKDRPTQSSA